MFDHHVLVEFPQKQTSKVIFSLRMFLGEGFGKIHWWGSKERRTIWMEMLNMSEDSSSEISKRKTWMMGLWTPYGPNLLMKPHGRGGWEAIMNIGASSHREVWGRVSSMSYEQATFLHLGKSVLKGSLHGPPKYPPQWRSTRCVWGRRGLHKDLMISIRVKKTTFVVIFK